MTAPKKAAKTAPDISAPGKNAPSATSKPVIVTNRPILQDPMMVTDESEVPKKPTAKSDLTHATAPTLQPLDKPESEEAPYKEKLPEVEESPNPPVEPEPTPQPTPEAVSIAETSEEPEPPEEKPAATKTKPTADAEAEAEKQRAANVEHLIEGGKYELPINSVEKRKTKRFVVLGILLAILLALAWADVALDAGIIHINNIQPLTHFFSN